MERNQRQFPPGGKVSVTLQLSKAKAESIDLYSFQDYICFDPDYLRFVSGSIRIYESEGLVLKNTAASAIKFSASPIDYENRIYINRADTDSVTIPGKTVILTFQLQAQKEGTTKITHDTIEIFRKVGNLESVSSSDATVVISKNAVPIIELNRPTAVENP